MKCWCRHTLDEHDEEKCLTCRKHWWKIMQPMHRFQPIEWLRKGHVVPYRTRRHRELPA